MKPIKMFELQQFLFNIFEHIIENNLFMLYLLFAVKKSFFNCMKR